MRLFVLGGPILPLIFIPMVGVAPSFLIQILFVSAGSIGQAMFLPREAGMISGYAGRH
jgi:FSR family fosmidomycin resistance protein-like MFS transporter